MRIGADGFAVMQRIAILILLLAHVVHGRRVSFQSSKTAHAIEDFEHTFKPSSLLETLRSSMRVRAAAKFSPSLSFPRVQHPGINSMPAQSQLRDTGASGLGNRARIRSVGAHMHTGSDMRENVRSDERKLSRAQLLSLAAAAPLAHLRPTSAADVPEGISSTDSGKNENVSEADSSSNLWYVLAGAIAVAAGSIKVFSSRQSRPSDACNVGDEGGFAPSVQDAPVETVAPAETVGEVTENMELPTGLIIGGVSVFLLVLGSIIFTILNAVAALDGVTLQQYMQTFDPKHAIDMTVQVISEAGSLGYLYFGVVYTLAEIVGLPAIPLTASAGYLFGAVKGTGVVLLSATFAASISFGLAKTFLRSSVQGIAAQNSKWRAIDKAVGREGLKVVLLLRLSPLLPFALSNYLYGLTSVDFFSYVTGTFFGFMPGTIAYVYFGQGVRDVSASAEAGVETGTPWYIYAGAIFFLAGIIKVVSNIAENAIAEMEEEEDAESSTSTAVNSMEPPLDLMG